MDKAKIEFTGNFGEFFIMSLGLLVLTFITFGIMFPYYVYWQYKYFVSHLEIELPNNTPSS